MMVTFSNKNRQGIKIIHYQCDSLDFAEKNVIDLISGEMKKSGDFITNNPD